MIANRIHQEANLGKAQAYFLGRISRKDAQALIRCGFKITTGGLFDAPYSDPPAAFTVSWI